MFEMRFEIDVRRVRPEEMGNALEAAMLQAVKDQVGALVGGVVCLVHGERARVTGTGHAAQEFEFTVEGCCDDVVRRVQAALRDG
jgi:hypothetical protein